jgi:hypothetical protein
VSITHSEATLARENPSARPGGRHQGSRCPTSPARLEAFNWQTRQFSKKTCGLIAQEFLFPVSLTSWTLCYEEPDKQQAMICAAACIGPFCRGLQDQSMVVLVQHKSMEGIVNELRSMALKTHPLSFALLFLAGFSGCIDNPATTDPPDVYEAEFQLLWDLFDSRYVGFQAHGTDWNALYEQFKPQAGDVSSRDEMTALTMELLSNLQDRGIILYDPAWSSEKPYSPSVFTNCSLEVLLGYLSPWGFQWMQEDVWGYCLAGADSVPCFVFLSWDGDMNVSLFDNILFQLQDEPAVILDIRLCQGG